MKNAFLKFSEVIALMIEGQGALLRNDQEEAKGKAASAALILNELCAAADPI